MTDNYLLNLFSLTILYLCVQISQACYASNCNSCPNDYYICEGCILQYGLIGTDCYLCNIYACGFCNGNNNACTGCVAGFGLSSGVCHPCSNFQVNCLECSVDGLLCTRCAAGYGVSGGACISCIQPSIYCLQCQGTDASKCTICQNGYGPNLSGVCVLCSTAHSTVCQQCSQTNVFMCTFCNFGYGPSTSGPCITCSQAQSSCTQCAQTNAYQCTLCGVGYGPSSAGPCILCSQAQPYCQQCSQTNAYYCTVCSGGYGPYLGSCIQCSDTNCASCDTDYSICTDCVSGFGVINGSCVSCNRNNCQRCRTTNADRCTYCTTYFGVNFSNNDTCSLCFVPDCKNCSVTYMDCVVCVDGYGIDTSTNPRRCRTCLDSRCIKCSTNFRNCRYCMNGYGPDYTQTPYACRICAVSNCSICSTNRSQCNECALGYGPNGIYRCRTCTDINCQNCSDSFMNCVSCKRFFGFANTTCVPCQSVCLQCQGNDYQACTLCFPQFYLNLTQKTCQPCSPHCRVCIQYTNCQVCYSGYALTQGYCIICPQYCTLCDFNTIYWTAQCTACQQYFQLVANSSIVYPVQICKQICGDNVTVLYPCDNDLGIFYDGCDDVCEVQSGFTCDIVNRTSTCSYTLQILIEITYFKRTQMVNSFVVKFKISPPLHVLKTTDICSVFAILDPIYQIKNCSFDTVNDQITFDVDFFSDVVNQDLLIQFLPDVSLDERYFATPKSKGIINIEIYFYNEFSLKVSKLMLYICYLILILGWLCCIVGLFMKRLAGVQAMITIQFAWATLLWLNTNMYQPFKQAKPLLYSTGLHPKLFSLTDPSNTARLLAVAGVPSPPAYPHMKQNQLDKSLLSNNFNIFLLLQVIPFLMVLVLAIVIKCMQQRHTSLSREMDKEDEAREVKAKMLQATAVKEYCMQMLMYFGMVNVVYFVVSVVVFFRFNLNTGVKDASSVSQTANIMEISSMVIMCVTIFIFVVTFVLLCCDPDPFDYFRYSFKKKVSTLGCWSIYIACVVTSVLLLSVLPDMSWPPMIPLGVVMLYVVAFMPYKETYENFRCLFNLLTMLSFLGLRVFLQYEPTPVNQSNNAYIIHLVNIILLMLAAIFAVASLIYYFYYIKYIKPKEQKNFEEKVMVELVQTDVRQNMRRIQNENNIFKHILEPKMSILAVTKHVNEDKVYHLDDSGDNILVNNTDNNNSIKKKSENIQNDDNRNTGNESARHLKENDDSKPQSLLENNRLRLREIMLEQRMDKKHKRSGHIKIVNNDDSINVITYESNKTIEQQRPEEVKEYFAQKYGQLNQLVAQQKHLKMSAEQQQEINKKLFAVNMIAKEGQFIRLKNAKDYTMQQIKDSHGDNKNMVSYMDAYAGIEPEQKEQQTNLHQVQKQQQSSLNISKNKSNTQKISQQPKNPILQNPPHTPFTPQQPNNQSLLSQSKKSPKKTQQTTPTQNQNQISLQPLNQHQNNQDPKYFQTFQKQESFILNFQG